MKSPQPSFPSFDLGLSQTPRLTRLPSHRQRRNSQRPRVPLSIHHNGFVQAIDERNHISRQCLDLPSAFIFEHDVHEPLSTNRVDRSTAKEKRLSVSAMILNLALAIRRKCYQFRIIKYEPVADADL
ncbi:hypothetical protein PILCRDRAFT_156066 [Piloderma croceum F 1598]|uniref:Uncharacterized protein n=1 Tax=Piloderma croceum (strain F 1598) TaxID=765440 RepID=A0A0C3G3R3_PILCF|nr:hypothetical protein PILCRDRAFT_156066 [Piloderma croceum F 1598]